MPRNNRDFQNRERWLRQQDTDNWGTRRQRRDFERRIGRHHTNTQGLREEVVVEEHGHQRTITVEPHQDVVNRNGVEFDMRAWQEAFVRYVENMRDRELRTRDTVWDDDLVYKYVKPYMRDREPEEFNAAQYVISVLVKDDREIFTFKQKIASADNANNIFIGTDWWQRMVNVADITIGERQQFIAPAFAL